MLIEFQNTTYFPGIKRVALVANGVISNFSLISKLIKTYEKVVAVDGGLNYCEQLGITPDLIIGDFDSVAPDLLQHYAHIPTLRFPVEKDDTDLELAIKIINNEHLDTIGLFGVIGNRVDHALNNLNLLSLFDNCVIEQESESIFPITHSRCLKCSPGQNISLLPLNHSATGVTTKGLQWELNNATLDEHFRSISNVCLKHSIEINIHHGTLICCLARNEYPQTT